jgi:hypothetical protein
MPDKPAGSGQSSRRDREGRGTSNSHGLFTGRSVPGLIRCMFANIGDPTQRPSE